MDVDSLQFREEVKGSDRESVRSIVSTSGFFSPDEVKVAVELVDEHLKRGEESGYSFLFAEGSGEVVGYACFGPVACTQSSYDLYWIAVRNDCRGIGLGRKLLDKTERLIAERGGNHVYVETSSRDQYEPTRAFYEKCGYEKEAVLKGFYSPGDDKVIYVKRLS